MAVTGTVYIGANLLTETFVCLETLCKRDSISKSSGESTYSSSCTSSHAEQRHCFQAEGDTNDKCHRRHGTKTNHTKSPWKPLLLFIPLRLGLSEMNSVYNEAFKVI